MAVGPYVGLQVQNHMSNEASFLTIFGITVAALICVSCCRIRYPKVERKKFSIRDSIYGPALPFMFNMMFLMIPYGAVIAYSSIFAQEKNLTSYLPYFYITLVAGMLVSKLSTQKWIDAGKHRLLVYVSLVTVKRSSFRNKEMRWLNATPFFSFRDGGNGRNGDLRGTHSIVATVATVAPYSVAATAGSSTTM